MRIKRAWRRIRLETGAKAGSLRELLQLRLELVEMRRRVGRTREALGRAAFQLWSREALPEAGMETALADVCAAENGRRLREEAYALARSSIFATPHCACGRPLLARENYCGDCGAPRTAWPASTRPAEAAAALEKRTCPGCGGEVLLPGDRYCGACGAPAPG